MFCSRRYFVPIYFLFSHHGGFLAKTFPHKANSFI